MTTEYTAIQTKPNTTNIVSSNISIYITPQGKVCEDQPFQKRTKQKTAVLFSAAAQWPRIVSVEKAVDQSEVN